jgi:hypothetical protein
MHDLIIKNSFNKKIFSKQNIFLPSTGKSVNLS